MRETNECSYNIKMIESYEKLIEDLIYYNNYFTPSLSDFTGNLEEYAKKLSKFANNFEITNKDDKRLGIISFYANDSINNIAYITLIVVDKEISNRGIGSILINFAEDYCKNKGMKKMKLEVMKDNVNALKFYSKHKYTIVEESEKTYYMIKNI